MKPTDKAKKTSVGFIHPLGIKKRLEDLEVSIWLNARNQLA
jgi:hypothetical protein